MDFFAEHTLPSLHSHVFGEVPDPAPIEMLTADVTCVMQDGKLLPFMIQKKELRKTLYGCRRYDNRRILLFCPKIIH